MSVLDSVFDEFSNDIESLRKQSLLRGLRAINKGGAAGTEASEEPNGGDHRRVTTVERDQEEDGVHREMRRFPTQYRKQTIDESTLIESILNRKPLKSYLGRPAGGGKYTEDEVKRIAEAMLSTLDRKLVKIYEKKLLDSKAEIYKTKYLDYLEENDDSNKNRSYLN